MILTAWQGAPAVGDERVRAVLDSLFRRPEYAWRERPDGWAPVRRAWNSFQAWLEALHGQNIVLYWLILGALGLVLALILVHAGRVAWRTMRADTATEVSRPAHRVARRDAAWYGQEAERLEAAGRYAEAMQADFQRLVLELDARRLVRFHPSRTPNEYVAEPALSPEARNALRELVRRLYTFVFARRPCGADDLRDWRSLASLERYARA